MQGARQRFLNPLKGQAFTPLAGQPAIALFAKVSRPHGVKTRLACKIGDARAQSLHLAFVKDALAMVRRLRSPMAQYLFLDGSSRERRKFSLTVGVREQVRIEPQRGPDLGRRLSQAFRTLVRRHSCAVILGVDSPTLPGRTIRQAFQELRTCDAVLGPCPDGGFYLIGLKSTPSCVFQGIRWGTRFAFRDMLRNIVDCGLCCAVLKNWPDVDRVKDLEVLKREVSRSAALKRRAPSTERLLREWGREQN